MLDSFHSIFLERDALVTICFMQKKERKTRCCEESEFLYSFEYLFVFFMILKMGSVSISLVNKLRIANECWVHILLRS